MRMLFIDLACSQQYSTESLYQRPIAGTESTVIRIAGALSKNNEVYVAQHCRIEDTINIHGVSYISIVKAKSFAGSEEPDVVVILRKYQFLDEFASLYPNAKKYFWMHDLPRIKMRKYRKAFLRHKCPIITVSHFHQNLTKKMLAEKWYHKAYDLIARPEELDILTIYNPIADDLTQDDTIVDKNKLVFFSSPNKGLHETIIHFANLRKMMPSMQLYIANPGYIKLQNCKQLEKSLLDEKGLIILGPLLHQEVIQHVREAFCVFYPQQYKSETFGLIYAEANAVGTPVLAHDFGPASEVLNNNEQLIDVNQPNAILNKLQDWYENGRPLVSGKNEFCLTNVARQWNEMMASELVF